MAPRAKVGGVATGRMLKALEAKGWETQLVPTIDPVFQTLAVMGSDVWKTLYKYN